jgi:hypothetical protein
MQSLNMRALFTHSVARALMALLLIVLGVQAFGGELVNLQTHRNATESIFIDAPDNAPAWVVVLFAGDAGAVQLSSTGPAGMRGNFLIRTARFWRAAGKASAIYDAPSDHASGMDDTFRLGQDQADDARAVVNALRNRYPKAKIALVGTSRGSISVGNILKREPILADAYVLSSPVTQARNGQLGLSGLRWNNPGVPVLVVSNANDGCVVSPSRAAMSMASENHFQFLQVSGNEGASARGQCGARSPHGFLGIEHEVLTGIDKWLMQQR